MKNITYGMAMIVLLIFSTLTVITIESRTNRENNQQSALKKATDKAIENVLDKQTYTIDSNEEFVAALTEMICDNLIAGKNGKNGKYNESTYDKNTTEDKNLKIVIEVVEADYKRGLLSLNIVNEFTNPFGSIGTCEYATTVVFDQAKLYDTYRLNYYDANGILIGSYIVRAGDKWPQPSQSLRSSYQITSWHKSLGGSGETLNVPSYVPKDSSGNNIKTAYNSFYDADTDSFNFYGNCN